MEDYLDKFDMMKGIFFKFRVTTSARKKCALGEAAVRPEAANPPGTPWAPGASGYWLHRTLDAWCVQIMVAWQLAAHCLLKGAFLGE